MVVDGRLAQSSPLQPFLELSLDLAANQFGHLLPASCEKEAPSPSGQGAWRPHQQVVSPPYILITWANSKLSQAQT
jgi:hypothetical protein